MPVARIMVIDDEPAILRALVRTLRPHVVEMCMDGPSALARLAAGNGFDAVVCDVKMAGMSGLQIWKALASSFPGYEKRVVFLTGSVEAVDIERLAQTGQPVVEKPFRKDVLLAALRRVTLPGCGIAAD